MTNYYLTPIARRSSDNRVLDTLGTDRKYIFRDQYKSTRTLIRYAWPTIRDNNPGTVFAVYSFGGSFQGNHKLLGYLYEYTADNYQLAMAHWSDNRLNSRQLSASYAPLAG